STRIRSRAARAACAHDSPAPGGASVSSVRVYVNFTERRGPYGGANSFLRTLRNALRRAGATVTNDVRERVDVALLNALTDGIDARLGGRDDVVLTLAGRVPAATAFERIRHIGPVRAHVLARLLKRQHVLLHLARFETCSNALLEGMNCGLPPIYLDSGSNVE